MTKLVNANTVKSVLNGRGTTFASLQYKSSIPTAAAHKQVKIEKRTTANVMLFQTIKDYDIYRKQVIRSANKIEENGEVKEFETSENWFEHADPECFSLIRNKKSHEQYLYFIANDAKSSYFIDGEQVDKKEIADYLTPSKRRDMFENDGIVYNKKNDIYHTVHPRSLKLDNIIQLKANKETMIA